METKTRNNRHPHAKRTSITPEQATRGRPVEFPYLPKPKWKARAKAEQERAKQFALDTLLVAVGKPTTMSEEERAHYQLWATLSEPQKHHLILYGCLRETRAIHQEKVAGLNGRIDTYKELTPLIEALEQDATRGRKDQANRKKGGQVIKSRAIKRHVEILDFYMSLMEKESKQKRSYYIGMTAEHFKKKKEKGYSTSAIDHVTRLPKKTARNP